MLGPKTFAYLDLTGSGAETIAHLRQNGRITLMFCSFGDAPKVLRIYGTGRPCCPPTRTGPNSPRSSRRRPDDAGGRRTGADQRAIIVVEADRIADSCGYAVPVMEFLEERDLLNRWSDRKSAEQLVAYRIEHNSVSIDGLPSRCGASHRASRQPAASSAITRPRPELPARALQREPSRHRPCQRRAAARLERPGRVSA